MLALAVAERPDHSGAAELADRSEGASRSSSLRGTLLGLGFSVVFTLFLAELGAAILIYADQIPARPPSYSMPQRKAPFFVDIDPRFGAWHPPNRRRHHHRACFSTVYRSNSYGALDDERSRAADEPRVIVLGDSFATGHGVQKSDRFSDRLEALTGVPHLNFGVGGTGPTQYLMVYEHLARGFEHDEVLVSVLPANDFFDDEPNTTRYRPYWSGEYPDYKLRYTLDDVADSSHHPSKFAEGLTAHQVLGSYSFAYNVADWVVGYRKILKSRGAQADFSGYFDFSSEQFDRLRYSLERLKALSPGRLTVVLIPRYRDLIRYHAEGESRLGARLKQAASDVDFELIDLLPSMAEDYRGRERTLFLSCDGHWSPLGHEVAAETIYRRLYASTSP